MASYDRPPDFIAARYNPDDLVLAGLGRRFAANLIDIALNSVVNTWLLLILVGLPLFEAAGGDVWPSILPFLVGLSALALLSLGWFVVTARSGQTPGKRLLGMYIIRADGTRAGGGYTALRELVLKYFVTSTGAYMSLGIYALVAALSCVWDKDRQCLWDKMASTYIAYSPNGYRPLTAAELAAAGNAPPAPVWPPSPAGWAPPPAPATSAPAFAAPPPSPAFAASLPAPVPAPPTASTAVMARARLGVIDRGVPLPDIEVASARPLIVGAGDAADIRISDGTARARHIAIRLDRGAWVLEDIAGANPALVSEGGEQSPLLPGRPHRIASGQVAIGGSVIILYPVAQS